MSKRALGNRGTENSMKEMKYNERFLESERERETDRQDREKEGERESWAHRYIVCTVFISMLFWLSFHPPPPPPFWILLEFHLIMFIYFRYSRMSDVNYNSQLWLINYFNSIWCNRNLHWNILLFINCVFSHKIEYQNKRR